MSETVSLQEVAHVAALANLQLSEADAPELAEDLNAVLGYIAQLSEVNTEGVEPMAQVSSLLGPSGAGSRAGEKSHADSQGPDGGAELRRDVVVPGVDRAAVMAEAPETDGRFFKVPRVIER